LSISSRPERATTTFGFCGARLSCMNTLRQSPVWGSMSDT
jgi:hypothetical protein